jgi:large subunit ribosomal protein L15
MKLNNLPKHKQNNKKKKLGRGYGSGKGGHTVGRGTKGQKARSKVNVGFEGGQIPLYKRLPQIGGFRNPTKKEIVSVSLSKFNKFRAGSTVTPKDLVEKGIIDKLPKHGVKILGNGELGKELKLKGFKVSAAAKKKIEESGSKLL